MHPHRLATLALALLMSTAAWAADEKPAAAPKLTKVTFVTD